MNDWIVRLLRWLVRKAGVETLFYWGLLVLILWTSLNSMQKIVRTFDPGLMAGIGLAGLLCGWLLGRSRWRASRALPVGLLVGVGWVLWQVGHLFPSAWEAFQAANTYFLNWLAWRPGLAAPPVSGLAAAINDLWNGLAVLLVRATDWAASALNGRPVFDPIAAALVWGLAVWLANCWASWAIRRWHRPLWAVTPSAALIGLSLAAVGGPTFSFLILLAASLAMLGWEAYNQQERRWTHLQVDYSEDLRLDVALVLVAIIMSLTSIAALSPSVSLQKLADWGDRLSTAFGPPRRASGNASSGGAGGGSAPASTYEPGLSFGESLGLAPGSQAPEPNALDELRASGGLPQEHLLGSGPELSEQIVLEVQVQAQPERPPDTAAARPPPSRYYWRAVTYDRYAGTGWATGPTTTIDYPADQRALASGMTAQQMIRQEIQIVGPVFGGGSILFAPGDLLAVSQDYQITWRQPPASDQNGSDLYGALARPADRPPRSYRIEALVSQASQEQLRAAGSRYPDWVLANDLLLPDSLPGRVRALALDLTATQPTPYDRARAIEAYLRTYPYTLDLGEPPGDRDLVDYFLFDLKEGYCDYYASAMVVLARAAGIPARLAVGYVGGTYDPEKDIYQVSAAEAHSWPEVYIPSYGWIGFEPTAGQPALQRAEQAANLEAPQWSGSRANFIWRVDWLRLGAILLGVLGLAGFAWLAVNAGESWWLAQLPARAALTAIYRRLNRAGSKLQIERYPGDTPNEFGRSLIDRLEAFDPDPDASGRRIQALVTIYSRLIYSPQAPDEAQKRQAVQDWARVRRRLWLARLKLVILQLRQFARRN